MDPVIASVVTAVIVGMLSLFGNMYASKKSASKTEALVLYRLGELEKKVDKHNSVLEWKYEAAQKLSDLCDQVRENRERISEIKQ